MNQKRNIYFFTLIICTNLVLFAQSNLKIEEIKKIIDNYELLTPFEYYMLSEAKKVIDISIYTNKYNDLEDHLNSYIQKRNEQIFIDKKVELINWYIPEKSIPLPYISTPDGVEKLWETESISTNQLKETARILLYPKYIRIYLSGYSIPIFIKNNNGIASISDNMGYLTKNTNISDIIIRDDKFIMNQSNMEIAKARINFNNQALFDERQLKITPDDN